MQSLWHPAKLEGARIPTVAEIAERIGPRIAPLPTGSGLEVMDPAVYSSGFAPVRGTRLRHSASFGPLPRLARIGRYINR